MVLFTRKTNAETSDAASAIAQSAAPRRAWLEWLCVALLVASAFLIRLWGVTRMHYWDENVYLLNAEYFYSGHAGYTEINERPPLLSLLFAVAFHVWHSDYAAETITALLNALGPAFLYLAGRRMVGRSAAAIAALMLGFGPFAVGACTDANGRLIANCNGHSLLTDCPALTLIALALWSGLRALERQTVLRFTLFGFAMAMAVLMRFGSLSSVGVLALLVLGANRRVRAAAACAAGFAMGMGPYLAWSRVRFGGFLEIFRSGWTGFEPGEREPLTYYVTILPLLLTWLGVTGLALWLLRRGVELWHAKKSGNLANESRAAMRFLGWESFLWFWAAAVMVFFSSLSHKESRYGLPLVLPLLLLAGVGLSWLTASAKKPVRTTGAVLLGALMIATLRPSLARFRGPFVDNSESEEMAVGEYLKATLLPTAVVYANQNYPDYAYYSGLTVVHLPESEPQLDKDLAALPVNSILVALKPEPTENDMAPLVPQPPIAQMDADPRFVRLKELPTVVIYRRAGH